MPQGFVENVIKKEDHTMKFDLFLSLLLGWVCVALSIGVIWSIASLDRDVRNDFSSQD